MKAKIISGIRMPPGHSESELRVKTARASGLSLQELQQAGYRILHKSVDARRAGNIAIVYTIEVAPEPLLLQGIQMLARAGEKISGKTRPVIAGAGPAGLFAALLLAVSGLEPILVEQGSAVEERVRDVNEFWESGLLDTWSNVQFGEGGAGTFSDGKLTTNIRNPFCGAVLEEMVLAGAPEEILYLSKPHIGTDKLRRMIISLRRKILGAGGQILFSSRVVGLEQHEGELKQLLISQRKPGGKETALILPAENVILAIGHSARDSFLMLLDNGIQMQPKPFSLGVRIEHSQEYIDRLQYKAMAGHPGLPPADYKMAVHLPDGRDVYTFCMCPGGQVVAAASEYNRLVVNGMSLYARNAPNANSALLVSVAPEDFPDKSPLGGMFWQRELEAAAFDLGGGGYKAPCQRLADFLDMKAKPEGTSGSLPPSYNPGIVWRDISLCLPDFVAGSLREALQVMDRKMNGYACPDAVLTAVESRSSSPLRIVRDNSLQANIKGIYPCGEGAGYAGGIMSAAVDGLRCAGAVISAMR